MSKYCRDLRVNSVRKLSDKHVLLKLTHDNPLPQMCPGQFVEVRVDNSPNTFLRRPISVNDVDVSKNELWLLVAAVGEGTRRLCQLQEGDSLNCLFPLGNCFTSAEQLRNKRVLLIGGGVGVAPLLYQGRKLAELGNKPSFLLGARSEKDLLELEYFEKLGSVYITT